MIGKIIGRFVSNNPLLSEGLLDNYILMAAQIFSVAILGAFLLCSLLLVLFYVIWGSLIAYGTTPLVAGIILLLVILMLLVGLVVFGVQFIRRVRISFLRRKVERLNAQKKQTQDTSKSFFGSVAESIKRRKANVR